MELRHLRYFALLAEELHFGRAAARAHIAQPPLSRQIRDLEAELGVQLFERNRRGVVLTATGGIFLQEVRELFKQLGNAIEATRRAGRGELGTLRIGYVGSVVYSGLPRIVRAFRSRFPLVQIQFQELSPSSQIEGLLADRLDVGFARGPIDEPSLAIQPVLDEPLMAALPLGHPLGARKELALAMLSKESFVLTSRTRGAGFHDHILTLCRNAGFSPKKVQEGSHFDVLSLVAVGVGVAILPASLRELHCEGVIYRALRERPRTQVVMISRKNAAMPVLREFIADMRRLRRGIRRSSKSPAAAPAFW